jgi:hypothetical protein
MKYLDNIFTLLVITITAAIGAYACDYGQRPIVHQAQPVASSDCPPQHKHKGDNYANN